MEEIEDKRLLDITAGEFAEILAEKLSKAISRNIRTTADNSDSGVIEGLNGLAKYLRISAKKAWRLRQSGVLEDAETVVGDRKYYYSKVKIDQMFK